MKIASYTTAKQIREAARIAIKYHLFAEAGVLKHSYETILWSPKPKYSISIAFESDVLGLEIPVGVCLISKMQPRAHIMCYTKSKNRGSGIGKALVRDAITNSKVKQHLIYASHGTDMAKSASFWASCEILMDEDINNSLAKLFTIKGVHNVTTSDINSRIKKLWLKSFVDKNSEDLEQSSAPIKTKLPRSKYQPPQFMNMPAQQREKVA